MLKKSNFDVHKQTLYLVFLLFTAAPSDSLSVELLLDTKVPDFQATDLSGHSHRLRDYARKIVVLEWSSPECPYSRRYYENGTLNSLYEFAAEKGIIWINIVPKLQKLTRDQAFSHLDPSKKIIILDSTLDISSAFNANTTPQILIVNKQGILSYSGAIDSSAMLKKSADEVIPYTRNALEDLLAGRNVNKKITRPFGCYIKNKSELTGSQPPITERGSQ